MDTLIINPQIGEMVTDRIEAETGQDCHVVIIALPILGDDEDTTNLGQPSFISSMMPDEMQRLLIHIGEFLKTEPTVVYDAIYAPERGAH